MKRVLVIGSGGREHALCWKLQASEQVEQVFCAPGNAGIAGVATCVDIAQNDFPKLIDFVKANKIDLTIVGPEAPLCEGAVDAFRAADLVIFGPDRYAAQLEGSKDFAKQFMIKYGIPAAASCCCENEADAAEAVKKTFADGAKAVVIKADGLAAGKGVLVAESEADALAFVTECFGGAFGESGHKVLVEECLFGEEASILALCDGNTIVPLVSSQDHKRVYDNDLGPNTGGMGAYSPAPVVTPEVWGQITSEILNPFLAGVQSEGLNFRGVIFVGVMVTATGAKVLEFNVRFGDPEIQPVLRRFDGDLYDVMYKTAIGDLANAELVWSDDPAVSVVIASGGYPADYTKGYAIAGLDDATKAGAVVFHAGTSFKDGAIVNSGGRVLGVSARGKTIREAIDNAYAGTAKISFTDSFYRKDIGAKALNK